MHDAEMGLVDISESEWPTFLYPLGTNGDEDDDRVNLFRGYMLPIVFRQIFTGPRTALDPGATKKGRPSKSRLHNMTEVTARTIAYTCIITRIALRGRGWIIDDGAFEHGVFYQNIVRMFETDPDDPWVKDTLAWWNE
ncbi:hypothetical protein BYT27DRAFT_7156659 [Phlegmacium glaucopus]|nr:hypothetical protein BYT27DRAFT_7156659 [Phlegmacium glaucopus]